jgi:hypothetical protein
MQLGRAAAIFGALTMTTNLLEILSYGFIQRALLAGSLIAVLCSVLGTPSEMLLDIFLLPPLAT